jgi:hypothetical protein
VQSVAAPPRRPRVVHTLYGESSARGNPSRPAPVGQARPTPPPRNDPPSRSRTSINDDSTVSVPLSDLYWLPDDGDGGDDNDPGDSNPEDGDDAQSRSSDGSSRHSADSAAAREMARMLAVKDKQLADMQRVIDLIIASNGPPPPPPGGGETTTGKNVPFGKMVASSCTRLVPAVRTWFPEGGHVPTAAQRVIMACYPPLHEQDLDIIDSMRRSDHESKTMKSSFDKLGPFSNGLKETDPQWQDYFRIFINYVADGNGAITYGAMIKVLRGSEMYTADITRVLQSEWDAESHYPDESMRPWHLRRCDLSNYDTAHKILCAVCIYLCEKYHRFETLAHIMSKLAEVVVTTNDWAGLSEMFNAQAVFYRRLSAVDRAPAS